MQTIRLVIVVTSGLLALPALAADLPRKAPIVAAPAAETVGWSGFYVGIHGGFGGGNLEHPFSVPLIPLSGNVGVDAVSFFAGGQVGYNLALGPRVVAGVEFDIAWSDIGGSGATTAGPLDLTASSDLRWFGTARGRLGYTWDRALIYATGGYAFGKAHSSVNLVGVFSNTQDHTKSGWAAGAGIEYALASNLTLKAEYLYLHFGSDNVGSLPAVFTINDEMNIHTVKAGLNWRFGAGGLR